MRPVCIKCHCFFRPKKNGFCFTEGMPSDRHGSARGLRDPSSWEPYKLWRGDLFECPDCKVQIIVGVARENFHEHYLPGFAEAAQVTKADQFQVNDC